MHRVVLEMRDIVKDFPGVRAVNHVNFDLRQGEILGLLGENGAGKSTLMKVMSGVYPYGTYEGDIVVNGKVVQFHGIHDAESAGIAIIHQELNLVQEMTVAENIFLGREPYTSLRMIDYNKMYMEGAKALRNLNLDISPHTKVKHLSVGRQQLVEIAKALSKNTKILVLDEPTSALTNEETRFLFAIVKDLRQRGVAMVYISHRLEEIFELCDRVAFLRDGASVGTSDIGELTREKMVAKMVGRDIKDLFPKVSFPLEAPVLEVRHWSVDHPTLPGKKVVNDVSFIAHRGEILGISGLMGAGRTELVTSLFGAFPTHTEGEILIEGRPVIIHSPTDAIEAGMSLLTEDRKLFGLVLNMSVERNTTLASLANFTFLTKWGFLKGDQEALAAEKYRQELRIKTAGITVPVRNLSGGNQQKVVIAKWLATNPKVLILDEPTRGVDVGAKVEIYNVINQLVAKGVAVIMISSELPEVLGMADRILVMRQGSITGQLMKGEATQESVMTLATAAVNDRASVA